MIKKTIVIAFLLCIVSYFLYAYLYKEHRDFSSETSIKVNTSNLIEEFMKDEAKTNTAYLNKIIEIKGNITQIDTMQKVITLDEKVFASFEKNQFKKAKINNNITIKGRFIGYDELLEELKLDNCTIIN